MSFDKKKFMRTEYEPRTEKVPVPDLKDFFDEGAEPVWLVRNLTGHELGKVNEAKERNRNIEAILEALVSEQSKEKAEAIKHLIGLNNDTPGDIVQRLEMLVIASVEPVCDQEMAVKICTHFPGVFVPLTNAIRNLTGQGAQVKKKRTPSGAIPTSGTPSPSATIKKDTSTK
jgi:hypothetical protein